MSCDGAPSSLQVSVLMRKHSKIWVFQQDICKNIPLLGLLRNIHWGKEKGEMNTKEQKVSLHWFILQFTFSGTELSIFHIKWCIYYYLFSRHSTIYTKKFFLQRTLSPRICLRGWVLANPHFFEFPSQLCALNIMWVPQLLFHRHVRGLQMLNMYVRHKNGLRLTTCTPR